MVPHLRRNVDLGPLGPADLARVRRGQHQELEHQLDGGSRRRQRPYRHERRSHVAMRQRSHVLHDVVLGTQHRQDAVARKV